MTMNRPSDYEAMKAHIDTINEQMRKSKPRTKRPIEIPILDRETNLLIRKLKKDIRNG